MCGIAGIVSREPGALPSIRRMTDALRHRGPDDEGYLLADSASGQVWPHRGADTMTGVEAAVLPDATPPGADVALGHRRLAILDLGPAGHGPMASPDGRLWITYNGEIYNYLELRAELAGLGHSFSTGTDTEVLLAAYAQWGPECLHRLNGMWAFALYDARRGEIFCARDRFGVKPFYYYEDPRLFALASEIKGLLAHPGVPRRPRLGMLLGFLAHGALDEGDLTFFEGVRSLPAAHRLRLDLRTRRLAVERWYDVPEGEAPAADPAELRALLEDAVRLRLRSDVDVGTCLSGGLDSSSIVGLAAGLRDPAQPGRHLTFSVAYPDSGLDEAGFIRDVVQAHGVLNRLASPSAAELEADLPALVKAQDEPLPSPAPYSQWRVMRLARDAGIKVLLDGQGADEILAGYHYHFGPYLAERARRDGLLAALAELRALRAVTGRSLAWLLGILGYHALPLPAGLRGLARGRFSTHTHVPRGLFDPTALRDAAVPTGERHAPRMSLAEERRANLWATSLPALLRYEDRSSMAFGIEARTPFLDYRLVEWALARPARALIRDGWTKAPLREAARGLVPESVRLRRDKLGFPTPERRFLRELLPGIRAWLGPGSRLAPLLRASSLRAWLAGPDEVLAARPGLWRLVAAELWLRYAEGPAGTETDR